MKKLLVAEVVAIALSIAIVVIGSIMGWSDSGNTIVTALAFAVVAGIVAALPVALTGAAIFATVFAVFATVFAATLTALVSIVVATAHTIPPLAFVSPILIIIVIAVVAAAFAVSNPKIKYRWAFLNLLGGGIIVWAVLHYGPGLLR